MNGLMARQRRVLSPREQGFSLVELIVAMMVIAVVLMLLIGIQVSAITTVTDARKLQQATTFANEAVEQMRAMPWQVLRKGMHSNFETASGGDPLVSEGYLDFDGNDLRLVIAPSTNDQDLDQPWTPLFDSTGSHTQIREDPSRAGVEFTIKAYVTEGVDGADTGTLGIAVVVEWPGARGEIKRTFVRSTVHQNEGCGNPATRPYLASCQDHFDANSGTGDVTMALWASLIDGSGTAVPLLHPDTDNVYQVTVNTANVAAALRSQQVTEADGYLQFGGHQSDDNDIATPAITEEGGAAYSIRATNDGTNQGGWGPTATMSETQSSTVEPVTTISSPSSGRPSFRVRSDYGRPGVATADMGGSCLTGILANQPCVVSELRHDDDDQSGSGYIVMDIAGKTFRLARPMNELSGSRSAEEAWAAHFVSSPGSSERGCTTLIESGCVAAGAERTISELRIGDIIGESWGDGDASDGIAIIEGASGCSNYTDGVRVQRGPAQVAAAPVFTRCGTVRYWTGSEYNSYNLTPGSNETFNTAPVTWTDTLGEYTVQASAQIRVLPSYDDPQGSAECATVSCSISAGSGTITITTQYTLSWGSEEYRLTSTTDITSPTARASYTAGAED